MDFDYITPIIYQMPLQGSWTIKFVKNNNALWYIIQVKVKQNKVIQSRKEGNIELFIKLVPKVL